MFCNITHCGHVTILVLVQSLSSTKIPIIILSPSTPPPCFKTQAIPLMMNMHRTSTTPTVTPMTANASILGDPSKPSRSIPVEKAACAQAQENTPRCDPSQLFEVPGAPPKSRKVIHSSKVIGLMY